MHKYENKEELTDAECLGDFWKDIFSLKITTEKERMIQENSKSDEESGSKPKEKYQEETGFNIKEYLREVMLFNTTPKVNLAGYGSSKSKLSTIIDL